MITAERLLSTGYEFFVLEQKIYLTHAGTTIPYEEFTPCIFDLLKEVMLVKRCWRQYKNLEDPFAQFIIDNFANFDAISDIDENGNAHFEGRKLLSKREIDYVRLSIEDWPDKLIAEKMNISINTATTYRQRITQKLNVFSKLGIAVFALKTGLNL